MNRWIVILVLALAALGAGTLFLGQGGWKTLPLSDEFSFKSSKPTDYVPGDTVLYFGGQSSADLAQRFTSLYPQPGLSEDIEPFLSELNEIKAYPPLKRFAAGLIRAYAEATETSAGVYDLFSIAKAGFHQIYLDGLVPVIQVQTQDAGDFTRVWVEEAEKAGLALSEEQIDQQTFYRIKLTPGNRSNNVDLIIAQSETLGVLTFDTALDTPVALLARLGLEPLEDSLASRGTLETIATDYGFIDLPSGFVDLEGIVAAILQTTSSGLNQHLTELFSQLNEPHPAARLDAVCRQEYTDLVGWMPRILAGYTALETEPEPRVLTRSILEIKTGAVLEQLINLNGHLPTHVSENESQILGMGLGLDMDQLMPVAMQLWSLFTQAQFDCTQLQNTQQQMAATNPALMGLFTGMAQGIKGVGLSLYDLEFGTAEQPLSSIDLLISIATENPQLVANLLSSSPIGPVQMPPQGGSQTLRLDDVQPGFTAELGLRGQHLTLSTGPRASASAEMLSSVPIEKTGLVSFTLDYPAFARVVRNAPVARFDSLMAASDMSLCVEQARLVDLLNHYPLTASYRSFFDQQGWLTDLVLVGEAENRVETINPVGEFSVSDQTWSCPAGVPSGHEIINEDGTGRYAERDKRDQCDLFYYEYRWTQQGNRLTFEIDQSGSRDRCDQAFESYDPYRASCRLIPVNGGFDCIYRDDESEGLYRYNRQ